MLTELQIQNFRAFGQQVTLRLRPVTILIGKNNAGKSSLIKFLLMLQQSLDSPGQDFLVADGPRVSLGAFSSQKNSLRSEISLRFALSFETSKLPSPSDRTFLTGLRKSRQVTDPFTGRKEISISVEGGTQSTGVEAETAKVDVTGHLNYRGQYGRHHVNVRIGDDLIHHEFGNTRSPDVKLLRFPARSSEPQETLVRSLADRFLDPIRYEIQSWRHLLPDRAGEENVINAATPPEGDVGQSGQNALPHLQRLLDAGGTDAKFAVRHLEEIADLAKIKFTRHLGGAVIDATAVNRRSGARCHLREFGYGTLNTLPVIVQGVITPPEHLMIVEQPEAQMHPTAQLEMGQFFGDLWTKRRVCSLIETHSGNILLRLRHLVAKGELKPEDVSVAFVDADEQKHAPVIKNLDIDEKGNLEHGLSMEFFGADIREALKMRAQRHESPHQ